MLEMVRRTQTLRMLRRVIPTLARTSQAPIRVARMEEAEPLRVYEFTTPFPEVQRHYNLTSMPPSSLTPDSLMLLTAGLPEREEELRVGSARN